MIAGMLSILIVGGANAIGLQVKQFFEQLAPYL